ncbi:unnamed protein product, partial [Rotaria magnacalcarata]
VPIQIPACAPQQQQPLQVTQYVQDIYPPAQVYTSQGPAGYAGQNSLIQQSSFNSQPMVVL